MIQLAPMPGKVMAVFGLGRTGRSAVRALKAAGAKVLAWDDNGETRAKLKAEQDVASTPISEWDWTKISSLVLSPGIPLTHPEPHEVVTAARTAQVEIISDIELLLRALGDKASRAAPVVAITGTNGKSTTTALVGHVLARGGFAPQVGGNIGKPVLDLDGPNPRRVYVLEVSSYQIDLTPSLAPDVGVLLNISPDHLDRHGGLEAYAAVKEKLFSGQGPDDCAVVGIDDAYSSAICSRLKQKQLAGDGARVIPITVGKCVGRGMYVKDAHLVDATFDPALSVFDLENAPTLHGTHNWQNAAAAYGVARAFKIAQGDFAEALETFPGLAHRQEVVLELGPVMFINDSKATNGASAARALASYDNIYWIVGGKPKDDGLEATKPYLDRVRRAYLIGEAAPAFAKDLEGKVETVMTETIGRAVAFAYADAQRAGKPAVVLLSPACASFDQFKDFEDRGQAFCDAVDGLTTPAEVAEASS